MKIRIVSLLMFFYFFSGKVHAQTATIKGRILDKSDNLPIAGANVQAVLQSNKLKKQTTVTDNNGYFSINCQTNEEYTITISYVGYSKVVENIIMDEPSKDLGDIIMIQKSKELADVTVISKAPLAVQKLDTIQYNASQYKTNPDATAEDLITKMPGITVDNAGNVTAHGDQVQSVTVDGKRFFGDDVTAALRNLPSEVIDKIQVFDKLSDQAQFTGFDDGNSVRAINIVTKPNMRNGRFGKVFGGYGTDGRYNFGGNINFFNGDRRISVVGLFNNINQQNFSSQDLLGFSSNSNRGGHGGSSVPTIGPQAGITATNALGINYDDMWGKKLEVQGSYFYNNGNVKNNQLSNIQTLLSKDSTQFENQTTTSDAKNYNQRLNLRFDYKINAANIITVTPVLNFQSNQGNSSIGGKYYFTNIDSLSNSILSNTNSNANGYNITNSILYRHAFAKKGRTVSLNLTTEFTKNDGATFLQSNTISYPANTIPTNDSVDRVNNNNSNGYQLSANIAYTEPIGEKGQLQLNYSPSYSKNKSVTGVYDYDDALNKYSLYDTSLSNNFNNTVTTQRTGVTYRIGSRENLLAVGLSYQYTLLNSIKIFPFGSTINESFNNVLPNLIWRKKISSKANLRIYYRASTAAPSITQLQNVINNTNPLFVTEGNPALNQQIGNKLSARYTYTNPDKGNIFFANVYVQQYNNYITNASFIAPEDSLFANDTLYKKGAQISKPVNLNGYVSLRSFLTYGLPITYIKSNVNFNAGLVWSRNPVSIQGMSSITNNYAYNTGLVIASNVSQYVDFTLSYTGSFNVVKNDNEPQLNNNYFSQTADVKFNLLSKKGWFVNNDLSNQSYNGLSNGFNQSYWLWNAAIGKKFLAGQRGELKLSGFDLLKQNVSIARTVTANYIEDDQNLILTQYFMLTFTYNLKTFGTIPTQKGHNHYGGFQEHGKNPPSF